MMGGGGEWMLGREQVEFARGGVWKGFEGWSRDGGQWMVDGGGGVIVLLLVRFGASKLAPFIHSVCARVCLSLVCASCVGVGVCVRGCARAPQNLKQHQMHDQPPNPMPSRTLLYPTVVVSSFLTCLGTSSHASPRPGTEGSSVERPWGLFTARRGSWSSVLLRNDGMTSSSPTFRLGQLVTLPLQLAFSPTLY